MTWAEFTDVFYHIYFMEADRERMVKDFNNLKQENMTVFEYVANFSFRLPMSFDLSNLIHLQQHFFGDDISNQSHNLPNILTMTFVSC